MPQMMPINWLLFLFLFLFIFIFFNIMNYYIFFNKNFYKNNFKNFKKKKNNWKW